MKVLFITLFFLTTGLSSLISQLNPQPQGKWMGMLNVNESVKLRVGIEWSENKRGEKDVIMHSLDQGAFDIPVDSAVIINDSIFLKVTVMDAAYRGRFIDNAHIIGNFTQGGGPAFELNFDQVTEFPVKRINRPQEPQKPYPYSEEEVRIKNMQAEGVTLAGTLTIPPGKGPFPAVILISGSGPNHRDANIFGHRVFLVLADYLSRNGIAVLRSDDRGTHKSTGDYKSADIPALGSDVVAIFRFLKQHDKINPEEIGVLGHSHGASIAPAAVVNEPEISFAILMAGGAESLSDNILEQTKIIYSQMGVSDSAIALNTKFLEAAFEIVREEENPETAKRKFDLFLREFENELDKVSEEELRILELTPPLNTNIIDAFMTPAMRTDLFLDPANYLEGMRCPTLILHGSKDVQVPVRHLYLSRDLIMSNGNTDVTAKEFENKNHLFQSSETGAVSEYKEIEETMSPEVMAYIVNWIFEVVTK